MRYQQRTDDLTLFNRGRLVGKKLHAFALQILFRRIPLTVPVLRMLRKQVPCFLRPWNGMKGLTNDS